MTRERFLQIAHEERFPHAEEAWEKRPDWAEDADDEEIRMMMVAVVSIAESPEFKAFLDKMAARYQAHAQAERN